MGTATLECCDLCGAPIEAKSPSGRITSTFGEKHAVTITHGFSRGGWGYRENKTNFSGEVCGPCWKDVEALYHHAERVLQDCRRRPVDRVQPVRSDEPQSERRGASLLRLVSPFYHPLPQRDRT